MQKDIFSHLFTAGEKVAEISEESSDDDGFLIVKGKEKMERKDNLRKLKEKSTTFSII